MRAFVTGAAGGIGSAIVEEFGRDHEVVGQDLDRPEADPLNGEWIAGDLRDEGTRTEIARHLDAPLDALLVAHGMGGFVPLERVRAAETEKVMCVNFASVVRLVRAALPSLRASEGVVVLIASQAGLLGEPTNSVYCASKFALVDWARAISASLASQGVRMRVLCPGCTDTELLRGAFARWAKDHDEDETAVRRERLARIPLRRFADAAEIARSTRYLAELQTPDVVVLNQSGGETFNA